MKFNRDNIYGIAGTLIVHALILLVLWFTVLKTVVPQEEEGVLVNFGNIEASAGLFEPDISGQEQPQETTSPSLATPPPEEAPAEEMIVQNLEESVDLSAQEKKREEDERKRKEQAEQERRRREEAEQKRLAEEQRRREEAISNKVAGAFGIGSAEDAGQGDNASGAGNQGSPSGNSDHGANEGTGGYGSFNLNGRTIGSGGLPRPAYTVQMEGSIVVNITVDPKGNVIYAEVGKGTNIDNAALRQSALAAARQARFNSIDGTNNQSGTITYLYRFK